VPHDVGTRINGIYEQSIVTPTGRLAFIRREDTFHPCTVEAGAGAAARTGGEAWWALPASPR
jgi:hypothetical protein